MDPGSALLSSWLVARDCTSDFGTLVLTTFFLSHNHANTQVKDKQAHLIRERESYEDLFAKERSVPATALPLQASSEIQEEPAQG